MNRFLYQYIHNLKKLQKLTTLKMSSQDENNNELMKHLHQQTILKEIIILYDRSDKIEKHNEVLVQEKFNII